MIKEIEGVNGKIRTSELGFTLMHEHLLCADWAMRTAFADWVERDIFLERAVSIVKRAMRGGVKTMVDVTAINLGRDIGLLKEVADRTGVQLIAATGLYWIEEPWVLGKEPKRIAEYFIRDIEKGIQGTGIKAGIVKCATDKYGFTEINKTLIKAAGIAAAATNTPVYTHTAGAGKQGLIQQELLEKEGVDLRRVVIGHVGDTDDIDYVEELIKNGSWAGLDRFGSEHFFPEENRLNNTMELCARGHADKLFLAHDHPIYYDWGAFDWEKEKKIAVEDFPVGYHHISESVIPQLIKRGLPKETAQSIMTDNPRRFFEGE